MLLQVRCDSFFEQLNELRIHELELVGNVQTDDSFAQIDFFELRVNDVAVPLLHNEDQVGPLEQLSSKRYGRLFADTG